MLVFLEHNDLHVHELTDTIEKLSRSLLYESLWGHTTTLWK